MRLMNYLISYEADNDLTSSMNDSHFSHVSWANRDSEAWQGGETSKLRRKHSLPLHKYSLGFPESIDPLLLDGIDSFLVPDVSKVPVSRQIL